MADFCRLLARDNKPIVSRLGGDDYIVVRIRTCSYVVAAASPGVRHSVSRWPRRIVVDKKRYMARNAQEEKEILRRFITEQAELRANAVRAEDAAIAKQAQRRMRYAETRLETTDIRRKQELRRIDEEIIILMVM